MSAARQGSVVGTPLDPALAPPNRTRQWALFSSAMAMLLAVALVMAWQARQSVRGYAWVEETMQVLLAGEHVHARLRSIESDARAYRLTDDAGMLAQFRANKALLGRELQQLQRLLAREPAQAARSEQLQSLARQRVEHLDALVQLQQTQGAEAARASSLSTGDTGPALMRAFESELDALSRSQQQLLDARKRTVGMRGDWLQASIVLGMLLALAMLGLLWRELLREARRRERMRVRAHAQARELQDSLTELGALSEQRRIVHAYSNMLQGCESLEEMLEGTRRLLQRLLPGASGRLNLLDASHGQLQAVGELGQVPALGRQAFAPPQCWAVRRATPCLLDAGSVHPPCPHLVSGTDGEGETSDVLCVPLNSQGALLGMLQVDMPRELAADPAWSRDIETIAEQLSLSIANLQLRDTLRQQSLRDALTGLFNRRYLDENMQRELSRCMRHGLPISVVMLDVDHFKQFNDDHGHAAGDAVLAEVGNVLRHMTRSEDIACRYGGEEFMLVLPETDHATALRRAEEIRGTIAASRLEQPQGPLAPVTASVGVATAPTLPYDAQQLQQAADAALYAAKRGGRNQVASAEGSRAQDTP